MSSTPGPQTGGTRAEAEWRTEDERGRWLTRKYTAAALLEGARPPLGRGVLEEMAHVGAHVTLVWKCDSNTGREEPWVIVAPSAVLRGEKLLSHDAGLGLYAWRDFDRDETIGHYTGESLGVFDEGDEEGISAAIGSVERQKADKVMEVTRGAGRVELIDGSEARVACTTPACPPAAPRVRASAGAPRRPPSPRRPPLWRAPSCDQHVHSAARSRPPPSP